MINLDNSFFLPEDHIHTELEAPAPFKKIFIDLRHLFRLFLKSLKSSTIRAQYFVARFYKDVYSVPNDLWLKENKQRRLEVAYKKKLFLVDGFFLRQIHNQIISTALNKLGCKSALEVGSGRGNNLISLAGANPHINFTGLDFSSNGTKQSLAWKDYSVVKPELVLTGSPPVDNFRFKNLVFQNGNALAMPFQDNRFDAAFTILALEQMPYNYHEVLTEMRRVSRKYCMFVEPFAEANNLIGKLNLKKSDYFRSSYRQFKHFGLEPITFFSDYYQKSKLQTGFLITRVVK